MKATLMLARFPYGHVEHDAVGDWIMNTAGKARKDPRIGAIKTWKASDTPIPMLRNRCLKQAQELGVDFVLMIDSDMEPDLYLGQDKSAKPFFETALDIMWNHRGPCCVAAPYAGPPPHEVPYIFKWSNQQSNTPDCDLKLEIMTREEVAFRTGVEEVPALPTGLILIDMRCLDYIPPPWFEYEYSDKYQTQKATTEDVFFTRNLSLAGVPQYVLWDCWAGHVKQKVVGKPVILTCDSVREKFRESIGQNQMSARRLSFNDADLVGPKQPHERIMPYREPAARPISQSVMADEEMIPRPTNGEAVERRHGRISANPMQL
jgi:hypothetical protein